MWRFLSADIVNRQQPGVHALCWHSFSALKRDFFPLLASIGVEVRSGQVRSGCSAGNAGLLSPGFMSSPCFHLSPHTCCILVENSCVWVETAGGGTAACQSFGFLFPLHMAHNRITAYTALHNFLFTFLLFFFTTFLITGPNLESHIVSIPNVCLLGLL